MMIREQLCVAVLALCSLSLGCATEQIQEGGNAAVALPFHEEGSTSEGMVLRGEDSKLLLWSEQPVFSGNGGAIRLREEDGSESSTVLRLDITEDSVWIGVPRSAGVIPAVDGLGRVFLIRPADIKNLDELNSNGRWGPWR